MRFAFKTSPQQTTWAEMLAVWKAADDIEVYESGWNFDHFYPIFDDPKGPCLEGWTTLSALAQATTRLRLGTMVTGIHYRHPAVLANMAAAVDIISDGRLELGVGSGWNEEESGAYGIELGTVTERFESGDHRLRWAFLSTHGGPQRAQGAATSTSADLHRWRWRETNAADHRQVRPTLEFSGWHAQGFRPQA
jgi:alkanesulfonate monooxygenase SsuD/methylene tetrahydromethanopterin reductase-like flavin-dependent oxidoreductase (luciferase family)